ARQLPPPFHYRSSKILYMLLNGYLHRNIRRVPPRDMPGNFPLAADPVPGYLSINICCDLM
ncbi:MAG: hypothetical protein ACKPKO_03775, partial [Candidatus Fonsibacter sp.]